MPGDGWIDVTDNNARLPSYLAVGLSQLGPNLYILSLGQHQGGQEEPGHLLLLLAFHNFTKINESLLLV